VPLYQTDPDVSPLLLIKVIVPLDGSVEMLDGSLETISSAGDPSGLVGVIPAVAVFVTPKILLWVYAEIVFWAFCAAMEEAGRMRIKSAIIKTLTFCISTPEKKFSTNILQMLMLTESRHSFR